MKKSLPFIFLLIFSITLQAQKDTNQAQKDTNKVVGTLPQRDISKYASNVNVTIYPVPVREKSFTIKTDRDVSFVKITNIIGQDIFRFKFSNPQQLNSILLNNPKRGMYLVTIVFADGTRVVKKIMVEESE
ncbi:MAG TPA: T9SS type A sorting domain-containing protein [Anaerovoracaceae bacterium]|nr:T9SS type A sorting domain-containing protein [Anaerovoracaceae bacterium]